MKFEKLLLACCVAILSVGGLCFTFQRITYSDRDNALKIFKNSCTNDKSSEKWTGKRTVVIYSCKGLDNTNDGFYVPTAGGDGQSIVDDFTSPMDGGGCFVVGADWAMSLGAMDFTVNDKWSNSLVAAQNYSSLTGGKIVSVGRNKCRLGSGI
jgi:hypothetical protein